MKVYESTGIESGTHESAKISALDLVLGVLLITMEDGSVSVIDLAPHHPESIRSRTSSPP